MSGGGVHKWEVCQQTKTIPRVHTPSVAVHVHTLAVWSITTHTSYYQYPSQDEEVCSLLRINNNRKQSSQKANKNRHNISLSTKQQFYYENSFIAKRHATKGDKHLN